MTLEVVYRVAPSGTYDGSLTHQGMRDKAVRCIMLKYALLMRDADRCNCARCETARVLRAIRLEEEP